MWLSGRNNARMLRTGGAMTPGFRVDAMMAVDDETNSLYLFGGILYEFQNQKSGSISYRMNDLWNYTYSSGKWQHVDGLDSYTTPTYYAWSNRPGPTRDGGSFYHRKSKSFYLFGGQGFVNAETTREVAFDHFWKYSFHDQVWIFLNGSISTSKLPTTPSSHYPGSLKHFSSAYDDASETWYIFGGSHGEFSSNALWKYEVVRNTWTLLKGTPSTTVAGVYSSSTLEVDSEVCPGSRELASLVYDGNRNGLWLFGGAGVGDERNQPIGELNDLWNFNITSSKWSFVNGKSKSQDAWLQDELHKANKDPVPRSGAAAFCGLQCNELYIFGGSARIRVNGTAREGKFVFMKI
jgi:hypothetical protein